MLFKKWFSAAEKHKKGTLKISKIHIFLLLKTHFRLQIFFKKVIFRYVTTQLCIVQNLKTFRFLLKKLHVFKKKWDVQNFENLHFFAVKNTFTFANFFKKSDFQVCKNTIMHCTKLENFTFVIEKSTRVLKYRKFTFYSC